MDTCMFIVIVIVLGLIGLVSLVAAVVEFGIWVLYTDHEVEHRNWRVRASPFVAVVWFLLGFAMVLMLYLVIMERMA
jgi:hypothetical protein